MEPQSAQTQGDLVLPLRPALPLRFDSRAEYACGVMLEKFVPHFQLVMRETLQIPVGFNKTIDFKVNGVFIEYHPCSIHHEFDDRAALRQLLDVLKRLKPHQRDIIRSAIEDELHEKYCRRRKFLLDATVGKDAELIVCRDQDDFYTTVIKRFGVGYPALKEFKRDFQRYLDGKIA
jgi:hypothetical protein